jgi:hypothetical protein
MQELVDCSRDTMASPDARPDRSPTLSDEEKMTAAGQTQGGILKDQPTNGSLRAAQATDTVGGDDVLGLQDLDPALNMKMHLVNDVRLHHALACSRF